MENRDRQPGRPELTTDDHEPHRRPRPEPGKVTLTSKLSPVRGPAAQPRAAAADRVEATPARSLWDLTMDPCMDAAHRGATALAESGQDELRPASNDEERSETARGSTRRTSMAAALPRMAGTMDAVTSGPGLPLAGAPSTRGTAQSVPFIAEMEAAFGADFSGVRAYLGETAALEALNAEGIATGEMVAFRSPTPDVTVVAHELTHVVQSRQSGVMGGQLLSRLSKPTDAAEQEASTVAAAVANGHPAPTIVERPAAEAQCSFISFAVKASAKQGTKAMLKSFIKQNIKDRLAKLLNKNLAKKYAREADEILEILEDPWWMTAIGFIPVVGDALDLARVPAQIRKAITRADEVEEAVSKALQQQRQIQKSIHTYGMRLAEHRAKLDSYRKNPDAFDNLGILKDAPADRRRAIIDGRIRHLEQEIHTFETNIGKLERLLHGD